jgi:hypothetical protein
MLPRGEEEEEEDDEGDEEKEQEEQEGDDEGDEEKEQEDEGEAEDEEQEEQEDEEEAEDEDIYGQGESEDKEDVLWRDRNRSLKTVKDSAKIDKGVAKPVPDQGAQPEEGKEAVQEKVKSVESESPYLTFPREAERPSEAVLAFFGSNLRENAKFNAMTPTVQLVCLLPQVECLWDWIPLRADLILQRYVWVLMQHITSGELSTVIWQRFQRRVTVVQNLCRLIAEATKQGPTLRNVFATEDFEGFQTQVSNPPRRHKVDTLRIENLSFSVTEYLEQDGRQLAFQFDCKPIPDNVDSFGSKPTDTNVWDAGPLTKEEQEALLCNVGRVTWNTYLQGVATKRCELTQRDVFSILKQSFPNANVEQKTAILAAVGQLATNNCALPETLLNDRQSGGTTVSFQFLTCGSFGCSTLWQYKKKGENGDTEMHKRLLVHTSQYQQGDARLWMETPAREFDMLSKLSRFDVAVTPKDAPQKTNESVKMLLIKRRVQYYSPIGEQFWTFSMESGRMNFQHFIQCGKLQQKKGATEDILELDKATQAMIGIFGVLKTRKLTHGDLQLGNIMVMPTGNLKLIDCGYSSDKVFMGWYDLVCFTVSCHNTNGPRGVTGVGPLGVTGLYDIARMLGDNVYKTLAKDPAAYRIELKGALEKAFPLSKEKFLPHIKEVADKDILFRKFYWREVIYYQLGKDGTAWIRALKLLKNPITEENIRTILGKADTFTKFRDKTVQLLLN